MKKTMNVICVSSVTVRKAALVFVALALGLNVSWGGKLQPPEEKDDQGNPTDYKNPIADGNTPGGIPHYHITVCEGSKVEGWHPWGSDTDRARPEISDVRDTTPASKSGRAHGSLTSDGGSDGGLTIFGRSDNLGSTEATATLNDKDGTKKQVVLLIKVIKCDNANLHHRGVTGSAVAPASLEDGAVLIGMVLPRDSRPGDTVTGTVVPNPKKYENTPGLQVVETTVPKTAITDTSKSDTTEATLEGLVVDLGDGVQQAGDKPLTVKIPENAQTIPLTVKSKTTQTSYLKQDIPLTASTTPSDTATTAGGATTTGTTAQTTTGQTTTGQTATGIAQAALTAGQTAMAAFKEPASTGAQPGDYQTPALLTDSGVQVINGALSGDGSKTSVAVDGQPATILAETQRAVYWQAPEGTKPGAHTVTLKDGPTNVSFPVSVMHLALSAPKTTMTKGEGTKFTVTLTGPETLPASAWKQSSVPSSTVNVAALAANTPDFTAPAAGDKGSILLRLENASPQTVSMPSAPGGVQVIKLQQSSFSKGAYTYSGILHAQQSGAFKLKAQAVSFVGPAAGKAAETPQ